MRWGSWIIAYDGKPLHRYYILRHATYPFILYLGEDSKSQWFYKKQGILFCVFATDEILSEFSAEKYFSYLTEYTDDLQQIVLTLYGNDIPKIAESPWIYKRYRDHITFTYKKTGEKVLIPKQARAIEFIDWASRHKIISVV